MEAVKLISVNTKEGGYLCWDRGINVLMCHAYAAASLDVNTGCGRLQMEGMRIVSIGVLYVATTGGWRALIHEGRVKMSMNVMDAKAVVGLLRKAQGTRSVGQLSREIGCSTAYVSDVYAGNRTPGPKILEYLGLEKAITYKKKWRKEDE